MNFPNKTNEMIVIGVASSGRPVFVFLVIDGRCMRKDKVCMNIMWMCHESCDALLIEFKLQTPKFDCKRFVLLTFRTWLVGQRLWSLFRNIDIEMIGSWCLVLTNMWERCGHFLEYLFWFGGG